MMKQVAQWLWLWGGECVMPPAARKQQLVFGNAGINSLLCIAQTGLVSRCAFPCQPTLHFIHWCSTLSPRHPAAARADADHASRRTHDRSPVPLAALPPGVRPTCSAASSPVRPRPRGRRHSCCLRQVVLAQPGLQQLLLGAGYHRSWSAAGRRRACRFRFLYLVTSRVLGMPAADTSRHLRRQVLGEPVLGAPHQRGSSQAVGRIDGE